MLLIYICVLLLATTNAFPTNLFSQNSENNTGLLSIDLSQTKIFVLKAGLKNLAAQKDVILKNQNHNNLQLAIEVELGTPPQKLIFGVNTALPIFLVTNGETCQEKQCDEVQRFYANASTSYNKEDSSDIIKFNGLSTRSFIAVAPLNETIGNNYLFQSVNSLGASFPLALGTEMKIRKDQKEFIYVKTPIENLIDENKIDKPLVTVWINSDNSLSGSQITIGGIDSTNCLDDWDYINVVNTPNKFLWTVQINNFTWGNYTSSPDNNDNQYAFINTLSSEFRVSTAVSKEIRAAAGIELNSERVNCSLANTLPPLKYTFQTDSRVYEIPASQYIVKLSPTDEQCTLLVTGPENDISFSNATWSIPNTFLRSHCLVLDFTSDKRRVGFATPKSSSATLVIGTALLFAANLFTFSSSFFFKNH